MPPKLKISSLHSQLTVALSLMPSHRSRHFLSPYSILFKPNLTTYLQTIIHRFFSDQSWLSVPGNPLIKWPSQSHHPHCPPSHPIPNPISNHNPDPKFSQNDFSTISNLFTDPNVSPGPAFEAALDQTEVEPDPILLQALFDRFDSSPKLLHTLFFWAEKQPGFQSSATLFNSMINMLAKSKKFDSAWSLVLDRAALVSGDTFAIIIRRYARAGMTQPAIRTFEFACNLDPIRESHSEMSLFEILLDSLCKEGHVKAASEYLDQKRKLEPSWVPSVRVYNILLNGWFRSRKLKHAEKLWEEMKMDDVKPSVVTYGTLVEGYCRMRYAERAIKLVHEMRKEGIEPNAIVYNPIIDALGEAQRFKEAMRMLERFLVLESGPTISTYNSLVKGFCKAGDLAGASKILKMMIGRGFVPTPTTYNYFFKYFSKHAKIEEGMSLYTKMIESGYTPDRLTYHLLMKMLCEEERLDLAVQMLGVFSGSIVSPPEELVAAGCRTPSPKITSGALVKRFVETNASTVSVQAGDHMQLAYTHHNQSPLLPRSFAVKDEIFCLFEGALDNLGSLRQQYGLAKSANEVVLVIEAYKALRDRAPYPANHVVGHLSGNFAFIVFDKSTSNLFVASDQDGKVPLYWGITADGYVAFADDADLLKGACGKSLASFPQGCFFSTAIGGLMSYENPKNKITAVPATDEEIWGATFKVEGPAVFAATE